MLELLGAQVIPKGCVRGGGEEEREPSEAEEGDDAEGEHGWRGAGLARIGRGDC